MSQESIFQRLDACLPNTLKTQNEGSILSNDELTQK